MSGHSPRGQAPGAPRAPPPTRSAGSSPGSWGWGGGRSGRHRRAASVWRGPVAPHASLRPFPLRRLSGNGRWTWLTGGGGWHGHTAPGSPLGVAGGAPRSGGAGRRGPPGCPRAPWAEGPQDGWPLSPGGRALWATARVSGAGGRAGALGTLRKGAEAPGGRPAWPGPCPRPPETSPRPVASASSGEGCRAWQEPLGLAGAATARWVPSAAGRGWPWPPAAGVHLKVGLAEPPFAPAALVTNTNV